MSPRIIGSKVSIDYDETLKFFEERGAKKNLKYLYNHTMYQDSNPDIVIERDIYEKKKILELLKIDNNDKVLDIGCGVGRWGEEVIKKNAKYLGLDFSKNLLTLASENLSKYNNVNYDLVNCSFQDMLAGIKKSKIQGHFNKIIITAVLIYLNDEDIIKGFNDIKQIVDKDCLIYIKETIALNDRLTLNRYYSDELKAEYDAIYRTKEEYKSMLQKSLLDDSFEIIFEDELYPNELKNRKETTQYFFLIKKLK